MFSFGFPNFLLKRGDLKEREECHTQIMVIMLLVDLDMNDSV